MKEWRVLCVLIFFVLFSSACVTRMSPFSPHRSNTEVHRFAQDNQACLQCHEVVTLSKDHKAADNCVQCHRILQGDEHEK